MLGCRGKVQREGDATHVIAEYLSDLSADLKAVADLDRAFTIKPSSIGNGTWFFGLQSSTHNTATRRLVPAA